MRRRAAWPIVLLALAAASPASAGAAPALERVGDSARWSGSISDRAVPHPAACTSATCHSYDVEVARGQAVRRRPSGLLVSLRWPPEQLDIGYDLDLYLYDADGDLVARSDAVAYSAAEGLWLQDPADGRYRIVVAPRDVVGTSPYAVVASLRRGYSVETSSSLLGAPALSDAAPAYTSALTFLGPPPQRPRAMLPDLAAVEPSNFHIESTVAAGFYQASRRVPAHQPSCYPQEMTGLTSDDFGHQPPALGPQRCLRWDMNVRNVGTGPLELRAYPESDAPTTGYQALYRSDGSYSLREVGNARFSSAHGHVHFHGLDEIALYTIGADGRPARRVVAMPDKGLCMIDLLNPSFGTAADRPSRYRVPGTCDAEGNVDPDDPRHPGEQYFRMGLSAGWEDIYPWFIPDQYIDITGVPDGRYVLVYRVNVSGDIVEATRSNNATSACVELHGTEVDAC